MANDSTIENLSNEIFYEIFDYVDGSDILTAFSDLNSRFQTLLHSPSFRYKIRCEQQFDDVFLRNYQQIYSIEMQYPGSNHRLLSSFIRLESLKLLCIEHRGMQSLLETLHDLPNLRSLDILLTEPISEVTKIYQTIFSLSHLKSCRFINENECDGYATVSLPLPNENQMSSIESMIISHPCNLDELSMIVSYTPQLRSLSVFKLFYADVLPLDLSNLTSLTIEFYSLTFKVLKFVLRTIRSQLKILHVRNRTIDFNYVDGQQWEDYLVEYLPKLDKFSLINYIDAVHFVFDPVEPEPFTSPFWIERALNLKVTFEIGTLIQEISTHKTFPQLTIKELPIIDPNDIIFYIRGALKLGQYYHLEILEENIFLGILLKILDQLPRLRSLKLHSHSSKQPRKINDDEDKILFSLRDTCQITNVYLESMSQITDIYFLMTICPNIKYLKIGSIYPMNEELFLREILQKVHFDNHAYLRSLCFHIPGVDDQICAKLKTMIDFERLLLTEYKLKRVEEDIYLEWK